MEPEEPDAFTDHLHELQSGPANVSGVPALMTVMMTVQRPCDVHDVFIHHRLNTVPKTHKQVGLLREDLTTTFDLYLQDVLDFCVNFRKNLL